MKFRILKKKDFLRSLIIFLLSLSHSLINAQNSYFPPPGKWEKKDAKQMGFNKKVLDEAVAYALAHEYSGARDLRIAILNGFSHEPYHRILGPTKKRGGPAGMIIKNGYRVAEWGDIDRVDMTFSVTKSYLSTIAGLGVDAGLFRINDKVANSVWQGEFDGAHNEQIRWSHLLNQSSDWSGTLWGLHDWADRPPKKGGIDDWKYRDLHPPGTHYKYNDVRVNLLAYSLLHVWRQPLPVLLKNKIMNPIGASSTWRWFGYDNSWINMDGNWVQSVSGGGHSGGGLFISTVDHARFGLLFLNQGNWAGQQLISKEWIDTAIQPSPANPSYGYLWWLNHPNHQRYVPEAGEKMFYAAGFGGNYIIVLPDQDMVIVTRWLEPSQFHTFVSKVLGSIR